MSMPDTKAGLTVAMNVSQPVPEGVESVEKPFGQGQEPSHIVVRERQELKHDADRHQRHRRHVFRHCHLFMLTEILPDRTSRTRSDHGRRRYIIPQARRPQSSIRHHAHPTFLRPRTATWLERSERACRPRP